MAEILYEDKNIVFCVKPSGVCSESGLPDILSKQTQSEIYTLHRLDKPVSGVMVYAKNKKTAAEISRKISEKKDFYKEYLCVCEGEFENTEGVMEDLLFKDAKKNKSFVVKRERKGVRKASLSYRVIGTAKYNDSVLSLVSVVLETGRSHQIRVQFASRKHPLFADRKYGSKYEGDIGLFSYRIKTGGLDFKKNPPDASPWNIFERSNNCELETDTEA